MANLNQSITEGVCVDEEIFFGPITEKERKIRENFESAHKSGSKTTEFLKVAENDNSRNDSLYKSFSIEDSKYDSFEDSLNEDVDIMPYETKHITIRKSYDKLKAKRHGFYDSLEDVCSLASNIEKCSISCDVENDSNFNNKQHIIEDSLMNPVVAVENRSHILSEQIHFDDDSLAIAEFENTFDDSLEEVNVLESIEIEEIDDIENVIVENQNIAIKIEASPVCIPRNLFDASVQVVYEKKKDVDATDQEESSDDKNLLYDSLSNSDFKDILKDSLDESDKLNENLNLFNCISEVTAVNSTMPESIFIKQNVLDTSVQIIYEKSHNFGHVETISEKTNSEYNDISKDSLENSASINKDSIGQIKINSVNECNLQLSNMNATNHGVTTSDATKEENPVCVSRNLFDTSVQIICENMKGVNITDREESPDEKMLLNDSISNSDFKDVSKEESEKTSRNLNVLKPVSNATAVNVMKPESIFSNQNALNTSVEITYEKLDVETTSQKTISECNNISKDSLDSSKSTYKDCAEQTEIETTNEHSLQSSNITDLVLDQNATLPVTLSEILSTHGHDIKATVCPDSNADQDIKVMQGNLVVTKSASPIHTNNESSLKKETFSVDSCQLKILNDNINIDKDMKFQLHIEVTVGDKKCQIASQDIKLVPVTGLNSKNETDSIFSIPIENPVISSTKETFECDNKEKLPDTLHSSNLELDIKNKDYNTSVDIFPGVNSNRKSEIVDTSNITHRTKSYASRQFAYSEMQLNSPDNLNDIALLQALDLHDISAPFLNESVIQSEDSLMPLNLCSKDQYIQNLRAPIFKDESKENVPEYLHYSQKKDFCASSKKISPSKVCSSKTPNRLQKSPSFKETTKKTPGTKIPVRKIEHFVAPIASSNKLPKSAEKAKKCQHSPHPVDGVRKTPGTTPNKAPHFCKVRNTIFSKVPQIVPSKKYMNIQSPVAQYIRNNYGPVRTPGFDPVLRDCMNRPMESPCHSHQTPKSGSAKSAKKKA